VNSFKHKVLSVCLSTVAAYFGFQALDLISGMYQVEVYFSVAWYVFIFHVFWLAFIFDFHLKPREKIKTAVLDRIKHFYHWKYVRHYLNYLILPTILYWDVVILMYKNPFHELFKDGLIVLSTISLTIIYWYFKQSFSRNLEMHDTGLKVLSVVKIFVAYLSFTTIITIGWYFDLHLPMVAAVVFLITFSLCYQALFQHRLLNAKSLPGIFMLATLTAAVFAVVYENWNTNYYTAGLMVVIVYNTFWSLLHRYWDKALNKQIFWEYVFMLIVLVSVVLSTHDFNGRI
jgi:hypothetical protein